MSSKSMTMKVDREFTVKRTKHPSAPRYNGRQNQELGSSLTKLMSLLDRTEVEQLCDKTLILDEEGTAVDFDAVLPTDVIGMALDFEGDGYMSTIIEVISNVDDVITGKDGYTEEEISFTFEEASVARAMGYFEVLYRKDADGKDIPFGVDNDLKVKVMVEVPEEEPVVAPIPGLPANIGDIASASTDPEVLKALIKNASGTGQSPGAATASPDSGAPTAPGLCPGPGVSAAGTKPKKTKKSKSVHVPVDAESLSVDELMDKIAGEITSETTVVIASANCGGECSSCATCTPKAKTRKKAVKKSSAAAAGK